MRRLTLRHWSHKNPPHPPRLRLRTPKSGLFPLAWFASFWKYPIWLWDSPTEAIHQLEHAFWTRSCNHAHWIGFWAHKSSNHFNTLSRYCFDRNFAHTHLLNVRWSRNKTYHLISPPMQRSRNEYSPKSTLALQPCKKRLRNVFEISLTNATFDNPSDYRSQ